MEKEIKSEQILVKVTPTTMEYIERLKEEKGLTKNAKALDYIIQQYFILNSKI